MDCYSPPLLQQFLERARVRFASRRRSYLSSCSFPLLPPTDPPYPKQHLYNSTFGRINVLDLLNPDLSLNEERYAAVGPLRLTPYFALTYGVSFAVLTAAITTVVLWHSGDIKEAVNKSDKDSSDIHVASLSPSFLFLPSPSDLSLSSFPPRSAVLERSYPSVPRSWYLYIFLANFAGAVVLLTLYPVLQLPVWGLFLAICIAVLFLAPVGVRFSWVSTVTRRRAAEALRQLSEY